MHSSSDTVTSFFGALEGEKTNSVAAQGGLPPVLKKACLHFAQFCESGRRTIVRKDSGLGKLSLAVSVALDGRLEGLMDKTFARLNNRYFPQESECRSRWELIKR